MSNTHDHATYSAKPRSRVTVFPEPSACLHSGEDEAVLIRLVVRRQIVEVQDANLEYCVVGTHAEVRYS